MAASDGRVARPFVIRDPIHGYLTVAAHERYVVDHPITQRLRRITQTGMADLVFPEARTSRFFHSLGAMHLASRFILSCVENADPEIRDRFFNEIELENDTYEHPWEEFDSLLEHDGTICALNAARLSFSGVEEQDMQRYRRLLALVESGLRFAALFHDLGHLPFSHDGEYALQDFITQNPKSWPPELVTFVASGAPHEAIGHKLAKLAIAALVPKGAPATRAAFKMGLKILDVEPPAYDLQERPRASALAWLHSLIDGEIDVDRADYLLRDGQALGLDFASYDVDRLVNSLVLAWDEDLGFVTAVKESGLSALESYCLSRSRCTEVFIHHHKVAQIAAALRYASIAAYRSVPGARDFIRFLVEFHNCTEKSDVRKIEGVLKEFSQYDDGWWIEVLRTLRKSPQDGIDPLLKPCLDLILDRSRTLSSVWKRKGDLSDEKVAEINVRADEFFLTSKGINLTAIREELRAKQILVLPFRFRPFVRRPTRIAAHDSSNEEMRFHPGRGPSLMLVKTKNRGLEAANISSSRINSLQTAWDSEMHLYACTTNANLEQAREEVFAAILQR